MVNPVGNSDGEHNHIVFENPVGDSDGFDEANVEVNHDDGVNHAVFGDPKDEHAVFGDPVGGD